MKRYIWIGILNISFCFGHIFAQKLSSAFYIDIEKNKKSFFSKGEISLQDYYDILTALKKEYGEDSEQYKFLIPDTSKFMELYGFPFFYRNAKLYHKIVDSIEELQGEFPMVAISYEQARACCQWIETKLNQHDKSYIWQCSLPEKADYEMALKKAKITQTEYLSPLQIKRSKHCRKEKDGTFCIVRRRYGNFVFGLTDNVAEYLQDGTIVEGGENATLKFAEAKDVENPIGFRFKLTVISKK
ncbi:MAG: hypothetical protein LBL58_05215 [Tannerellaceae bacterium]|jgi:hypothetical protein|nr:hypothetical protein [Tannerellaceae bacterium]